LIAHEARQPRRDWTAVWRLLATVVGLALICGSCVDRRPLQTRLDPQVAAQAQGAILFLIDGMDQRTHRRLLAEGSLPCIQRVFVRGGVEVDPSIVSVPAVTYANTVSLLTGCFPGAHGVLGNRWFDRRELRGRDYDSAATFQLADQDYTAPTIFELLAERGGVNVHGHTHRGATRSYEHPLLSGLDWLIGDYTSVDRRTGRTIEAVARLANEWQRWPALTLLYFPGVDQIGHERGADSGQYAYALENADAQVGRVYDALDRAGVADALYFVLVTDHGQIAGDRTRIFDLAEWLRRARGLRVTEAPPERGELKDLDAIVLVGANRMAKVYLRGEGGWEQPASEQDVLRRVLGLSGVESWPISAGAGLLAQPGVELVCVANGPGRALLYSHRGVALLERREGVEPLYRYSLSQGEDPLRYRGSPGMADFLDAWRPSRDWLAATATHEHPDLVPQLAQALDSPRAGDALLFAEEGWQLRDGVIGGHGSCRAEDMRVSFYFAGPGLPRGAVAGPGRLVDVLPTLLDLLGESGKLDGRTIDGVSLVPMLHGAAARP